MGGVASDTFSSSPYYGRDCFLKGLSRAGYTVGHLPKENPDPEDVLLIWNRSRANHHHANVYEAAGARVLVAENAYIGQDSKGHHLYSIALGHHLGAGTWKEGVEDRWTPLNINLAPWRSRGREIIVLPQRGFGEPGIAMPMEWTADVVNRLRQRTDRPIRVRPHPGKGKADPIVDLKDAWAAVTWASGAGIKSLVSGVPVFHEMPSWIGGPAAKFGIDDIERPFLGDRIPMLRRLAWSQWNLMEIEQGTPFKWLL